MSLTVEQKINLLILAGYIPKRMLCDARIGQGSICLYAVGGVWAVASDWTFQDCYNDAKWEELYLDTCPDELIYEACKC